MFISAGPFIHQNMVCCPMLSDLWYCMYCITMMLPDYCYNGVTMLSVHCHNVASMLQHHIKVALNDAKMLLMSFFFQCCSGRHSVETSSQYCYNVASMLSEYCYNVGSVLSHHCLNLVKICITVSIEYQ